MSVKMPEPVAYLVDWPDEIELGLYFSEEKNDSARSRPLITTEQAEAYAQAVRDEAEKLSRAKHYGSGHQDGWNSALDSAANHIESLGSGHHVDVYAESIRALKMEQS